MINKLTPAIAFLALLGGIYDAGRLAGFGLGSSDPLQIYSISGFTLLGVFAIARIFSAVGMWIKSNWGTPLLFGTTLIEMSIFLSGMAVIDIGIFGFAFRLIQLAGSLMILVILYKTWHSGRHD